MISDLRLDTYHNTEHEME